MSIKENRRWEENLKGGGTENKEKGENKAKEINREKGSP